MTRPLPARARRPRPAAAAALLLALCVGCETTGFAPRRQPSDPDVELARCLDGLRDARADDGAARTGAVASWEGEVRRLALEFPAHVPTLLANALLSGAGRDREGAQRYLDRLLALDPGHVEAAVLRGHIALQEGNVHLAREVLSHAILLAPDRAELHETLAAAAYVSGELDEARAGLARAQRLGAPAWRTAFDLGLVEEAAGDPDAALRQYAIALQVRPDFPRARARDRALRAERNAPPDE